MEASSQLTVAHRSMDCETVRQMLEKHYGSIDKKADAIRAAKYPARLAGSVLYGCATPDQAILFVHQDRNELQVAAFHLAGDPYKVAQSAWDGTRNALNAHKPKCKAARIIDRNGATYAIGKLGFWKHFREQGRIIPVLVAIASLIIVLIGASKPAVQVPAFIAGIVSLILILRDTRARKFLWSPPGG